jgi:hypothetical protein
MITNAIAHDDAVPMIPEAAPPLPSKIMIVTIAISGMRINLAAAAAADDDDAAAAAAAAVVDDRGYDDASAQRRRP